MHGSFGTECGNTVEDIGAAFNYHLLFCYVGGVWSLQTHGPRLFILRNSFDHVPDHENALGETASWMIVVSEPTMLISEWDGGYLANALMRPSTARRPIHGCDRDLEDYCEVVK